MSKRSKTLTAEEASVVEFLTSLSEQPLLLNGASSKQEHQDHQEQEQEQVESASTLFSSSDSIQSPDALDAAASGSSATLGAPPPVTPLQPASQPAGLDSTIVTTPDEIVVGETEGKGGGCSVVELPPLQLSGFALRDHASTCLVQPVISHGASSLPMGASVVALLGSHMQGGV